MKTLVKPKDNIPSSDLWTLIVGKKIPYKPPRCVAFKDPLVAATHVVDRYVADLKLHNDDTRVFDYSNSIVSKSFLEHEIQSDTSHSAETTDAYNLLSAENVMSSTSSENITQLSSNNEFNFKIESVDDLAESYNSLKLEIKEEDSNNSFRSSSRVRNIMNMIKIEDELKCEISISPEPKEENFLSFYPGDSNNSVLNIPVSISNDYSATNTNFITAGLKSDKDLLPLHATSLHDNDQNEILKNLKTRQSTNFLPIIDRVYSTSCSHASDIDNNRLSPAYSIEHSKQNNDVDQDDTSNSILNIPASVSDDFLVTYQNSIAAGLDMDRNNILPLHCTSQYENVQSDMFENVETHQFTNSSPIIKGVYKEAIKSFPSDTDKSMNQISPAYSSEHSEENNADQCDDNFDKYVECFNAYDEPIVETIYLDESNNMYQVFPQESLENEADTRKRLYSGPFQKIVEPKRLKLNETSGLSKNTVNNFTCNSKERYIAEIFNNKNTTFENCTTDLRSKNIFNSGNCSAMPTSYSDNNEVNYVSNSCEKDGLTDKPKMNLPLFHTDSIHSLNKKSSSPLKFQRTLIKIPELKNQLISISQEENNKIESDKELVSSDNEEICLDSDDAEIRYEILRSFPQPKNQKKPSNCNQTQANTNKIHFKLNNSNRYVYKDLMKQFGGDQSVVISYLMENQRLFYSGELVISKNANQFAANYLHKHKNKLIKWYGDPEDNTTSKSLIAPEYHEALHYSQRLLPDLPRGLDGVIHFKPLITKSSLEVTSPSLIVRSANNTSQLRKNLITTTTSTTTTTTLTTTSIIKPMMSSKISNFLSAVGKKTETFTKAVYKPSPAFKCVSKIRPIGLNVKQRVLVPRYKPPTAIRSQPKAVFQKI